MDAIPLNRATLCINCECVTASQGKCGVCGSQSLLSLQKVLDAESGTKQKKKLKLIKGGQNA